MSTRAQILTDWVVGPLGAYRPRVINDHPPVDYGDVTGQPTENLITQPNGVVIEGVWDDGVFAALLANPQYGPESVLWSVATTGAKSRSGIPRPGEHAALGRKLIDRGYLPNDVDAAIGKGHNGRTRSQLSADIASYFRDRPKLQ